MWTLDELVERVGRALAAEYPGAPNGRVRDVPDRRAVRWYTTTGLVDRPLGLRGRSALYGPRHLLQLVALKRRQAEGRTLAEIQAELAGAGDDELAAVARVPAELLVADGPEPDAAPARTRFWATPAPRAAAAPQTDTPTPPREVTAPSAPQVDTHAEAASACEVTAPSAPQVATASACEVAAPSAPQVATASACEVTAPSAPQLDTHAEAASACEVTAPSAPQVDTRAAAPSAPHVDTRASAAGGGRRVPGVVGGVVLGRGAMLVFPGTPTAADRAALADAARPLLELLADRGLLDPEDGSPS